jgi:upstream activation factor subunit UAF30
LTHPIEHKDPSSLSEPMGLGDHMNPQDSVGPLFPPGPLKSYTFNLTSRTITDTHQQFITELIMERFDKFQREREAGTTDGAVEPAPSTNGATHSEHVAKTIEADSASPGTKRKASSEEDEEDGLSDAKDTTPPKKVKKESKVETDEQIARRLQAQYAAQAGGARSTRGGGATKKKTPSKPVKKSKKKSAAKINSDDDSDVEGSSSPKPAKEKKGGFHKPLNLSQPLQELLGETQLSRPETVKRIWAYVKERDLQDPADKRQIRCDDAMRAVFKSDKVHMFTMNKILAGQLYPVEE